MDCLVLKQLPLNLHSSKADYVAIETEEDWWKGIYRKHDATKKISRQTCQFTSNVRVTGEYTLNLECHWSNDKTQVYNLDSLYTSSTWPHRDINKLLILVLDKDNTLQL